jgi:hypothetical protein
MSRQPLLADARRQIFQQVMNKIPQTPGCGAVLAATLLFVVSNSPAQTPSPNVGPGQGWTMFGDTSWVGSDTFVARNAPGSDWNPSGGYDIVTGVNPGSLYTFSLQYLTATGITLPGDSVALMLTFENSSWVNIGTVESGYGYANGGLHFSAPVENLWYPGSVSGTAPAGAVSLVAYAMFMDNGQTTTEDVYFTGMNIMPMPAPEPSAYGLVTVGLGLFALRKRRV